MPRKFFFPINTVVALGSRNADEFFDRTIIATVGNESIFLSENQIEKNNNIPDRMKETKERKRSSDPLFLNILIEIGGD